MNFFEIKQEIDHNLAQIKAIDSLIGSIEEEKVQSMRKIKQYEVTIKGANKDKRYGLAMDCRDEIHRELAEIRKWDKYIKLQARQKDYLIRRNDELRAEFKNCMINGRTGK